MKDNYYELEDDVFIADRWHLGSVRDAKGIIVNPEVFRCARRLYVKSPLSIDISVPGHPLDFTFGCFEMPVVNYRTGLILQDTARNEFEAFPAHIGGTIGSYYVINFLESRDCVDEVESEFIKWTKDDHRSDLTGKFRQITRLRIDLSKVHDLAAFRIVGWDRTVVVSESVKKAFEKSKVIGVKFSPVC